MMKITKQAMTLLLVLCMLFSAAATGRLAAAAEESPALSVEFDAITIPEKTGGGKVSGITNGESYEYYKYYWYNQLSFTITYKDGSQVHYTGNQFQYNDETYTVKYSDPQSRNNPFQMGKTYTIAVTVMDLESTVQVMITGSEDTDIMKYDICDGKATLKEYADIAQVVEIPAQSGEFTITGIDSLGMVLDYAEELVIPDTVTEIAPDALLREGMPLKKLVLGNGISHFDASMIAQALALEEIAVSEDHPYFSSIDGVLFDKTGTVLIAFPAAYAGSYRVPDSVENINALFETYMGQELKPGAGVTDCLVEDGIIYNGDKTIVLGCYGSKTGSYVMPDSVVEIHPHAFQNCGLESVMVSKNITEIPANAFCNSLSLKTVSLPSSITAIGADAFAACENLSVVNAEDLSAWCKIDFANEKSNPLYYCGDLTVQGTVVTELTLPDTFTGKIEDYVFVNGTLTAVTIPAGVTAIGSYAFMDVPLESITFSEGVTEIGDYAFAYALVNELTLPDSLQSVGSYGFFGCIRLEQLDLGAGLRTIGEKAFSLNRAKRVVIPESVTAIGASAFSDSAMRSLIIDSDSVVFGTDAFAFCPLESIELSEKCTQLASNMFSGANAGYLKLPSGMTSLEKNYFYGMRKLAVIVIPESVETVSSSAFDIYVETIQHILYTGTEEQWAAISTNVRRTDDCTVHVGAAGDEITVTETCTQMCYHCAICDQWIYVDKVIQSHQYDGDKCTICGFEDEWEYEENGLSGVMTILAYKGSKTHVTVPEKLDGCPVMTINDNTFKGNTTIESVTIPDGVTYIGVSAFEGCTNLQEVNLPQSLSVIGTKAFKGCNRLMEITIPDGVTQIRSNAFENCIRLLRVELPSALTYVSSYCFSSCSKLKDVVLPDGVTYIGTEAFAFCSALNPINIPESVTQIYTKAFQYCYKLEQIKLPASLTDLSEGAFYMCKGLTKVTMDCELATIPTEAFAYCESLTEITLPKTLKYIGEMAFRNVKIAKLDLPEGLVSIGPYAFLFSSLESVVIPDTVTRIANDSFRDTGLRALKISSGASRLESLAFASCSYLKRVVIPEGVSRIEDRVFSLCSSLRSISLSDTVTYIGYMAFCDLCHVKEITIPASVTGLGSCAFGYAYGLESITFLGDAPTMDQYAFHSTTTTCYYTAGNVTWTNDKKLNYGGTITWVPMCSDPTPTGRAFSLSFDDTMKVNFYYTLKEITNISQQGMLVFYTDPGEPDFSAAREIHSDCKYDETTGRFMGQSNSIDVKYWGDTRYYCAYGKSNEGPYIFSPLYAYSPKKYAANILAKASASQGQKALCVSMLNYGAAAQTYFGYKTDDLMNADLTEEQRSLAAAYDPALFNGAASVDSSKVGDLAATDTGFSKKTATVSFESTFAINYYFTPNCAVDEGITFCYWTQEDYDAAETLTPSNATGSITMSAQSDGRYWARITDIAPKDFDATYYVAAFYTSDTQNCCTGVISYSISKYCMKAAASGGDMAQLVEAAAMYGYYTKAYFGS